MMKRKTSDLAVGVLIRLVYIATAMVASCVCTDLLMKMLVSVVNMDGAPALITRVILTWILGLAVLFVLSFREGYHYVNYRFSSLLPQVMVATAVQLALSFLLGFHRFVAGASKQLAGWMYYGSTVSGKSPMGTGDLPVGLFLLAFAFVALTDALCMILSHKYGSLKRLIDREQLTGNAGMTQGDGSKRENGEREE